jgi:HK97 family phage major capsid protein
VDELIRKLLERRAQLMKDANEALAKSAESLAANGPKEDRAKHDATVDEATKAIEEIDGQVEKLKAQQEREKRAAAANAGNPHTGDPASAGDPRVQVTSEPTIYGRGSGHSYFLDQARATLGVGDGDDGVKGARERQSRHEAELRVEMPKRLERRRRDTEKRMDDMLSGGDHAGSPNRQLRRQARREQRIYERFLAAGGQVFQGGSAEREQRFISRTDGSGGYFVPPLWLIDEYIPYLRAGRTFADLWRNFPLPSGTDSINLPRVTLGTATGTQAGDGAPVPGRDAQDSFVNARVMTVAGQQDAAIQLLDQSPIAFDEIIFGDLAADYNMQLSAQLMLGSGFPQLNGIYPTGVLNTGGTPGPTATGFYTSALALTTAMWSSQNISPTPFYTASAQLLSQIARTRFLPVTQLISNPMGWYALAAAADSQGRPLVVPAQQGMPFNELAWDNDGPVSEGPVGRLLGVGWQVDPNIPFTFGGTTAPSIGVISNGSTAPVPGSGGNNVYTPLIAAVWNDLFLWEGEMRSRTLSEVLSGTLQVRFQLYAYNASMANRYQNAAGQPISYGNVNSVGATGAALSQGSGGGLAGF